MKNNVLLKTIAVLTPFIIAFSIFFVRIESRLSRIETDITWIKKSVTPCQQNSEEITR